MGLSKRRALGAIRLSLGRLTTQADMELAASALIKTWRESGFPVEEPERC